MTRFASRSLHGTQMGRSRPTKPLLIGSFRNQSHPPSPRPATSYGQSAERRARPRVVRRASRWTTNRWQRTDRGRLRVGDSAQSSPGAAASAGSTPTHLVAPCRERSAPSARTRRKGRVSQADPCAPAPCQRECPNARRAQAVAARAKTCRRSPATGRAVTRHSPKPKPKPVAPEDPQPQPARLQCVPDYESSEQGLDVRWCLGAAEDVPRGVEVEVAVLPPRPARLGPWRVRIGVHEDRRTNRHEDRIGRVGRG